MLCIFKSFICYFFIYRNFFNAISWTRIIKSYRYFNYFKHLLSKPAIKLTGDITPSYSMLDSNAFADIKNGLESVGLRVKVVFLMRDPVERLLGRKVIPGVHREYGGVPGGKQPRIDQGAHDLDQIGKVAVMV